MKKKLPQPPAPPRSPQNLWIYVGLFAVTLALYFQAGRFDFTNYDDPIYVSHNPHLRDGLTFAGLRWAFTSGEGANWFPVTRLSHLLDAQLFGMQSGWPHLVNVLIHALTVLLLFAFLERATRRRWLSAFVAMLFSLHPLHVESVAWISERKDVLCACFWMLSLWMWTRGNRRLSLLAFALGLMSKPMIVSLPFQLLLLDVWPLRRKLTWQRSLLEKAPFFALSGIAAVVTWMVQQSGGAVRSFAAVPLGLRIENALVSYVVYIGQMVWPADLAVFYPYPADLHLWQVLLALTVLVGTTVTVLRCMSAYPYLTVGWFWYLITLAPVIGIVQVGGQAHADRYMYVPMIGLSILLVWGAADLLTVWPRLKPLMIAAAAFICMVCGALTWIQTGYWRDSVTLFQHAVNVTQCNDIAQHNLGNALLELPGRLSEAIGHLQAAVSINPDSASAHTDLGNALSKLPGRLPDAIAEYRAAVRIDGDLPIPHSNLGGALIKIPGGLTDAIAECQTAVRLDPDFADARANLGRALSKAGRQAEAVTQFETALRLEPDNPEIHDELGQVLASANNPGHLQDAIVQYQGALQHDPSSAETQYNLALALAKAGKLPDAIAHFEASLRLNPNNAAAQNNLGFALTNYPARLQEAIGHFQAALRINPDYADAHYNLGVALVNTGRIPEAIPHLKAAERLNPDPELEKLIQRLGQPPNSQP